MIAGENVGEKTLGARSSRPPYGEYGLRRNGDKEKSRAAPPFLLTSVDIKTSAEDIF
jgi:hypothetical protein